MYVYVLHTCIFEAFKLFWSKNYHRTEDHSWQPGISLLTLLESRSMGAWYCFVLSTQGKWETLRVVLRIKAPGNPGEQNNLHICVHFLLLLYRNMKFIWCAVKPSSIQFHFKWLTRIKSLKNNSKVMSYLSIHSIITLLFHISLIMKEIF